MMHYWSTRKPLPDDDNGLQQIARIKPSRVSSKVLSTVRSFFTVKDGLLYHKRIEAELANSVDNKKKNSEKAKKAAGARWNNKHQSSNAPSNAPSINQALLEECPSPSPYTDGSLHSPSGAPPPEKVDFKKTIFDQGLKLLGGSLPNKHRPLVGKWLRDYGEAAVVAALMECQRNEPVDPKSYIEKILKEKANANPVKRGQQGAQPTKTELARAATLRSLSKYGINAQPEGEEA